MSSYHVKTEVYEGPLDVLLSLIEKRKLLINDISLAAVADDFITYVEHHTEYKVAETAHFILIASTLLLIKSKSLLPVLTLTEEETANIEDLEQRLVQYKKYKDLSLHVAKLFGKYPLYFKTQSKIIEPFFSPDVSITLQNLKANIDVILSRLPKEEKVVTATVKQIMSLEETIDHLAERVQTSIRMSFKDFSGAGKKEKVEIVVSFLALLELVKRGIVKVEQEKHFSDILMESGAVDIPHYG